jgi:hypothetical protein
MAKIYKSVPQKGVGWISQPNYRGISASILCAVDKLAARQMRQNSSNQAIWEKFAEGLRDAGSMAQTSTFLLAEAALLLNYRNSR